MAFTGKATYSAFGAEVAIDVAPIISMRAPIVSPILDFIGDASNPATSVAHTWREDEYAPAQTLVCSTALNSVAGSGATVAAYLVDFATYVHVGDVLQLGSQDDSNGIEHIQVASYSQGNSIYLRRAVFGTSVRSATAGTSFTYIANASLEGEAMRADISRIRVTKTNYVQPIVKAVEVSLSMEAVTKYNRIGSEFDHQAANRISEVARDLENSIIRGTSGETIGSSSVYRTVKGIWSWITNTHTCTDASFDTDFIDNALLSGWQLGRIGGYNLLIAGVNIQKLFDGLPDVQRIATQDERGITRVVRTYESGLTGGPMRIILTPNIDPREFIITHTDDLAVVPLQGRSFQFYEYARTGQTRKGEVAGEYTVEVRNAVTMVRGYVTA